MIESEAESMTRSLSTWSVTMTTEDLVQIKSMLQDLRFIQAAALVGSKMHEHKDSVAYMRQIVRLIDLVDSEVKK